MSAFPRIDLKYEAPRRKFTLVGKEVYAEATFHIVAPGIKLHFEVPDIEALRNWTDFEDYLNEEEVALYRELLHARQWSDGLGELCTQAVIADLVRHKAFD